MGIDNEIQPVNSHSFKLKEYVGILKLLKCKFLTCGFKMLIKNKKTKWLT